MCVKLQWETVLIMKKHCQNGGRLVSIAISSLLNSITISKLTSLTLGGPTTQYQYYHYRAIIITILPLLCYHCCIIITQALTMQHELPTLIAMLPLLITSSTTVIDSCFERCSSIKPTHQRKTSKTLRIISTFVLIIYNNGSNYLY